MLSEMWYSNCLQWAQVYYSQQVSLFRDSCHPYSLKTSDLYNASRARIKNIKWDKFNNTQTCHILKCIYLHKHCEHSLKAFHFWFFWWYTVVLRFPKWIKCYIYKYFYWKTHHFCEWLLQSVKNSMSISSFQVDHNEIA